MQGGPAGRGRSGLAGHQHHGGGDGGQRDPGGDRGTILGAPTLLHARLHPRVHEAIPLCNRARVRPPDPAPPRAVPCLRSWPARWGGGRGARGSGSG